MTMISVVIRTLNEQEHLPALLEGISNQELDCLACEVIVVDSGSTDDTLIIAQQHGATIVNIRKADFTFGRSLNIGCAAARGDILVFISGHCIPCSTRWLADLVAPLLANTASYCYGRQLGWQSSYFSECQIFRKYFPDTDRLQTDDFFCNNANAALKKSVWTEFRFDESLTGLEDMELGQRLIRRGHRIAYVASAGVYHIHNESWSRIKTRYERESIALQHIMPQVHVDFSDFLRYFCSALFLDIGAALQERQLLSCLREIVLFRLCQFWGSYRGNHEHRKLSNEAKERYFYPK